MQCAKAYFDWVPNNWKATKEYLNHRGTKIGVFSHPFSLTLPPLSYPVSPSSPPPSSPCLWLLESSIWVPLWFRYSLASCWSKGRHATARDSCRSLWNDNKISDNNICEFPQVWLSWDFPGKTAFLDNFPSKLPFPDPLQKANFIRILSFRRLWS